MVSPKKVVVDTTSKIVPSKVIFMGKLSNELLKSRHFVFWRFSDNLFALIQDSRFSSSETMVWTKVLGSECEKKTFESSAKSINDRM